MKIDPHETVFSIAKEEPVVSSLRMRPPGPQPITPEIPVRPRPPEPQPITPEVPVA